MFGRENLIGLDCTKKQFFWILHAIYTQSLSFLSSISLDLFNSCFNCNLHGKLQLHILHMCDFYKFLSRSSCRSLVALSVSLLKLYFGISSMDVMIVIKEKRAKNLFIIMSNIAYRTCTWFLLRQQVWSLHPSGVCFALHIAVIA